MHSVHIAGIYGEGAIFSTLTLCVYLHSLLHRELRNKAISVKNGALRLIKVIQGHRNWYQIKSQDVILVVNSNLIVT